MRTTRRVLAVLVAVCLAIGLLAAAPAAARHGANGSVCMVLDPGGADDGGYNAGAVAGLERAERKLHVEIEITETAAITDIAPALEALADSGDCDLIIGMGFIVGPVVGSIASHYPDQSFAVIDSVVDEPNVASVVFAPNEAAFLAGYIAAGVSETGKIGTYGGIDIPPITDWMNGYALGADYYNAEYGAAVEVLGWDVGTQTGLFAGTFADPAVGYVLGELLIDEGADTIMPVAGFTGFGTLQAVQDRKTGGEAVRFIGVDFDAFDVYRDPIRVILTSVLKKTDVAVFHQVEALVDGTWSGGVLVEENLASNGVDIAPFHKLNRIVPGHLKNDFKAIRAGIVDGSIPTLP